MQFKIDQIINSDLWFDEKVNELKTLFSQNNILYFSDFDDTLSTNDCVFYTKVKLLKKFNKYDQKSQLKILNIFKLNPFFPKDLKDIIIISRNDIDFIKLFIVKNKKILSNLWINIVWWIWTNNKFKFTSAEKLNFLPENAYFIWDSFEDKSLQSYKNFVNVDKMNIFRKNFVLTKKIFILIKFIIKWF